MSKKVTIIRLDDWEALYVDGELIGDYHEMLDNWMERELSILGYTFEHLYADPEEYKMRDSFPRDVTDVLLEDGFYYGEEEQYRL